MVCVNQKEDLSDALAKHRRGDFAGALAQYRRMLALAPDAPEVLHLCGLALHQLKQSDQAVSFIQQAIALKPGTALFARNLGQICLHLGRLEQALDAYTWAIAQQPDDGPSHYGRVRALLAMKRWDEGLALVQSFLSQHPSDATMHFLLGQGLEGQGHVEQAMQAYRDTLVLAPTHVDALNSLGILHLALHQYDEAVRHLTLAINIDPGLVAAYNNRGVVYQQSNFLDRAKADFQQVKSMEPDQALIHGKLIDIRLKQCDWQGLEADVEEITDLVHQGQNCISPLRLLSISDSLSVNRQCAEQYARAMWPTASIKHQIPPPPPAARIRLGYFSADMHNHATAFLAAEMFEAHDRNRFEVFVFSFGPEREDGMRQRIRAAVEHFVDVRTLGETQMVQLARRCGLDIAVDLKGYTQDARSRIFVERCAPVQVSYLGYPGTLGIANMDYLLADRMLVPPESQSGYTEKIAYLPHSYQINDSRRVIASQVPTRAALGLPDDATVFACFNNNFKIMPQVFAAWMRILHAVPGSVLWLLRDNPWSETHLRAQAQRHGLAPGRLVFAKRAPLPDHLARHRQADLFLDTWPYNAHTTASDALWAGLPVLTLCGQHFPSRVGASLLTTSGLPELITHDLQAYTSRAIELAMQPHALQRMRDHLDRTRTSNPLFDAVKTTRAMEDLYVNMHQDAIGLSSKDQF